MSDHSELKNLLEYVVEYQKNLKIPPDVEKFCRLTELTKPTAVLALIAEVEGLRAQHGRDSAELRSLCQARDDARKERDQLKAEVEALRKLGPSKEIIWCACGDGYPVNSYGAGFMDANNGVCANCDAAMTKGDQP